MVEKRSSPLSDSPQRRKRLNTQDKSDAQSTQTDTSSGNSTEERLMSLLDPPQAAVSPAATKTSIAELPMLIFHHQFPILDLCKDPIVTNVKNDAQGASWRVMWQPRSPIDETFVGVFVELVLDTSDAITTSSRSAELSIILVNQDKDQVVVKNTSVHAFSKEDPVFGMNQFIRRSDLLNPSNQFLTKEGKVEIEVHIHFVEDVGEEEEDTGLQSTLAASQTVAMTNSESQSTIESTQSLLTYDSKEETGMVGLKNQGATCYLNSLLQTLFHLRAFRQVVYETPTAQEDTNESVSLALQRVFYRLQRERKAVSTKELTRSFGWSAIDSFMQHDVQELYRILCDRLEEKMKHTRVDSAIPKLFEGKVRSFVQCVNVEFQSTREESFYDLQLDVKGCKDLMQSFRKYVEVEMLDGDNQYEAEEYGKQDAKKGIEFVSFPPILNLQLKRFEYDPMRDGMVKIHDRFEFPKTLVLDEFIQPPPEGTEQSPRYIYHLHSVLVHSGDVHGGHYYVFIRPGKHIATSTDWFKFDDDQITRVDEQVAIEGNFGSGGSLATPHHHQSIEPPSSLYSSSLFSSPARTGEPYHDTNRLDGLEFQSVDTERGSRMVETNAYDDDEKNGTRTIPGRSTLNRDLLPLGRRFSSAYMLVYVRDGENDTSAIQNEAPVASGDQTETKVCPLQDISMANGEKSTNEAAFSSWESDPLPIPVDLVTRFQEEEQAVARRKKAQQTEHLYMNFRIASDTSVAKLKRISRSTDFSGFNNSSTLRIRIKRAASIRQLYRRIYRDTGVPMTRQRLWKVITRENRTTRPDQALGPDVYDCRVDSLIEEDSSLKAPVKLYLQILNRCSSFHAPRGSKLDVKSTIHRHFWDEFTRPDPENAVDLTSNRDNEEEKDSSAMLRAEEASEGTALDHAPPIERHEIVLFLKFYDVKKKLGERLDYVGNIMVDARITGAEFAQFVHEALSIPLTKELLLFEEVQPTAVSAIEMDATLAGSEIQNGDIICFQFAQDAEQANVIVVDAEMIDPDAYLGPEDQEVKTVRVLETEDDAIWPDNDPKTRRKLPRYQRKLLVERYPDVPSYFQYLLDRVDVTFYRYGGADDEPFTLSLLYSNVYDEIIDAVAAHLGLFGPKRLFLRLYQHSRVHVKVPLRHSRYAGDDRTTLEELLTQSLDRTTCLYYELLEHPITEIEAKKELLVHLSIYDACLATEQTASPSTTYPQRRIEVLVMPTHTVRDMLALIRQGFGVPEVTPLRACEVVHHGTMIQRVIPEDASLSQYWGNGKAGGADPNTPEILVEQIPIYEILNEKVPQVSTGSETKMPAVTNTAETGETQGEKDGTPDDATVPVWYYKGVVHFNFSGTSQQWIHPHGVPCVIRFAENDTVGDVKERIRQRMGISDEIFAQWKFALVKDLKASLLQNVFNDMEPDALDAFPMARLTELCGDDFEDLGNIGLEHADPTPVPRHHSNRRLETGIHIR